jgi:antitoxin component HigA of HigAB toxin-antitoxin module
MAIDYNKLYKKVYDNRLKGIKVKDTLLQELGHSDGGNFYKAISNTQLKKLSELKGLTESNKKEFKRLYLEENKSASYLAKKFNIRTKTSIDYARTCTDKYVRSFKAPKRKLTKYQVIKILLDRMLYGTKQKDLAEKYCVSPSNISNICAGRHWKHVFQGVKNKYNKEILSINETKRYRK